MRICRLFWQPEFVDLRHVTGGMAPEIGNIRGCGKGQMEWPKKPLRRIIIERSASRLFDDQPDENVASVGVRPSIAWFEKCWLVQNKANKLLVREWVTFAPPLRIGL